MGVKIDLPLICKVLAAIFCAAAIGVATGLYRIEAVSNSLIYATGGFIILLIIFLGWTIFEGDVDNTFSAWMMICGCVWNIGAGLGVIIFYIDNKHGTGTMPLVGGCLDIAAGILMLLDALIGLGVI